jgi:hypothetical protein
VDGVLTLSEGALVGGSVFGSGAIFTAAVLAWVFGALSPGVGVSSLVAGVIAGFLAVRVSRAAVAASREAWTRWQWLAVTAFALVSLRQFGWLVFERDGALLTLLPHNYGDLPLHWTYIQHFASGAPFWPENPILTGERLRYPLGVDLLTAVFVQLGLRLEVVLRWVGLAGAALAALALRRWGGALAVAGFLFVGGLVGLASLFRLTLVDVDAQVAWKNLFLALFVPQRGFLLALPAGLVLLSSWRGRLLRGETTPLPAWVEGLLWGALPLVHLHTFAFVSVVGAAWAIGSGRFRAGLPSLALALLPATWAVVQVTDGFRAAGLVGWSPGWVMGAEPPLVFLLRNFGLWLPLALGALVVAARARLHEELLVLVPALAIFASLFLVRLAPWAWDNTKVMLWCYVATLPALASLVLVRLPKAWRAVTATLLLASGLESVLWGCVGPLPRLEVLDRVEYTAVCETLARVPTTRVATAQTFNHPVALCGRKIVAGYPGHLWSHGLESREIEARLKRMMEGAPAWRADARALGASHVFWGVREAAAFPGSARPWEAGSPVASGPWGALYRLD